MRRIVLTRRAQSDLVGIWSYTRDQWDSAQADTYLDVLDRGIRNLSENPELGARRDHVRKGYRALFIHRHAVYYTVTQSTIRIVRVLYGQMDPRSHL